MFYEYETIKDLISWNPPIELRRAWADHLLRILKKNNKSAPWGWFRNLLHPIGSKIAKKLAQFEKEIISNLQKTLELTGGGSGSALLLAQMWGVSERTIKRILVYDAEDQTIINSQRPLSILPSTSLEKKILESPKISRKRKESTETPLSKEMDKCKKSSIRETPQNINNLKSYEDADASFEQWSINDNFSHAKADMFGNFEQEKDFRTIQGCYINSNIETPKFQNKWTQTISEDKRKKKGR